MTYDERMRALLHAAADECLSGIDAMPSRRAAVLARLHGRSRTPRRSLALAAAILAMLALSGTVAAAGMGLFGWFGARQADEGNQGSGERLARLEETAAAVGQRLTLTVPQAETTADPQTVRGRLLNEQRGQTYEMTIDQLYCDGRKLYYAYTLRQSGERLSLMEGEATGFDGWDEDFPGEPLYELDGETGRAVAAWLDAHDRAYAVVRDVSVGDGACLPDGTYLNPVNSDATRQDGAKAAYFEVELPEGYAPGDTLDFELTVTTTTTVYAKDESGVHRARLQDPGTRIAVQATAPVTPAARTMTGAGEADGFPAAAELRVSDVDAAGEVRIEAPEDYEAEGYVLRAGGAVYRSVETSYGYADGVHTVSLRFDLPASLEDAAFVPWDPAYAHETIDLK